MSIVGAIKCLFTGCNISQTTPSPEDKEFAGFIPELLSKYFQKFSTTATTQVTKLFFAPNEGDGVLAIIDHDTKEVVRIRYRDALGNYIPSAEKKISYLCRCHLTGQMIPMSRRTLALLDEIQDHFNGAPVRILSGYRSPANNRLLRRKDRKNVGKNSYHMYGRALDIYIEGVSAKTLRNYAKSLKAGGVGYYPFSKTPFVHIDDGDRIYCWTQKKTPRKTKKI